jgi:hypothetical protein
MFKNIKKEEKILENEEPVKLNIKPIVHNQITKLADIEDDTTKSRLKAFQMMKSKNGLQDFNRNLYINDNQKEKKKEFHQNIFFADEEDQNQAAIENRNYDNKSKNLFVLNKFEEYYNDKIEALATNPNEIDEGFPSDFQSNSHKNFSLQLNYTMGINTNSVGSMCFHKDAKWVAYLNRNLVIIESFEKEADREQKILKDSNNLLSTVKISENGSILVSFSKKVDLITKGNPEIFFWDCKKDFVLIHKTVLKHKEILDAEISMQNNFCAVLSK